MTSGRMPALVAIAAAVAVVIAGFVWGTYAAGGSDWYCYLNQAELLASGRVHDSQPLVERAPWPDAIATALPPGHIPAPGNVAAIVPMCASGYAALMAGARVAGGRAAMFWVVPLAGGFAVYCTFLLGRRVAGAAAGAIAAGLLAASPDLPAPDRAADVRRAGGAPPGRSHLCSRSAERTPSLDDDCRPRRPARR